MICTKRGNVLSPTPFRRPLPAGLRLSGARDPRATLLREGDARAVIVKLLFFQLAAPGIAAGA